MQNNQTHFALVRLTMTHRSSCEWAMERLVDAPWIPSVEDLSKAVMQLDTYSDEKQVQVPSGRELLSGYVVRGPSSPSRSAYLVLWPQTGKLSRTSTEKTESLPEHDVIGRILLLLMRGGGSGAAAAKALADTSIARRAARKLPRYQTPEFENEVRRLAAKAANQFDALLIEACLKKET